jgi:hypothetical protein
MKIIDTLKDFFAKGPKPIIPNETTKKAIKEARDNRKSELHHHNHGSSTT